MRETRAESAVLWLILPCSARPASVPLDPFPDSVPPDLDRIGEVGDPGPHPEHNCIAPVSELLMPAGGGSPIQAAGRR
jgi:hypothetical protein